MPDGQAVGHRLGDQGLDGLRGLAAAGSDVEHQPHARVVSRFGQAPELGLATEGIRDPAGLAPVETRR